MRYLGIDLAWSERDGSGVCVIDEGGHILDEAQLVPAALPDWVRSWRGDRSVLALDGPLVVPARSPAMRPVERELHRRYGRYHAGPFPGGAASTSMRGRERSPAAALVAAVGDTSVDPEASAAHRAIEVFPAPSWIELFGLDRRVVYKRGRKADRIAGLRRLRDLLARLDQADPPMRAGGSNPLDEMVSETTTLRDWKAIEDVIDARLCAYVGLRWHTLGSSSWVVTGEGTWRDGYVVVPQGPAVSADA